MENKRKMVASGSGTGRRQPLATLNINPPYNTRSRAKSPKEEKQPNWADILPMKTVNEVLELENNLKDEKNKESLITLLKTTYATNSKEKVRLCFKRLMSQELSSKCSWTGQKQNFAVKDLI